MTRIVLYALAAANVPMMEQIIASVRCGEDGEPTGNPSWGPSTRNIVMVAFLPSGMVTGLAIPNRKAGRAIRRTPVSEIRPENAS